MGGGGGGGLLIFQLHGDFPKMVVRISGTESCRLLELVGIS